MIHFETEIWSKIWTKGLMIDNWRKSFLTELLMFSFISIYLYTFNCDSIFIFIFIFVTSKISSKAKILAHQLNIAQSTMKNSIIFWFINWLQIKTFSFFSFSHLHTKLERIVEQRNVNLFIFKVNHLSFPWFSFRISHLLQFVHFIFEIYFIGVECVVQKLRLKFCLFSFSYI